MKKTMKKVFTFMLAAALLCSNTMTSKADSVKAKTTTSVKDTEKAIKLKSLSYDLEDDDDDENIDIDFSTKVRWKSTSVTVTDENHKSYAATIDDKDSDDLSLNVAKLTKGHAYTIKIKGIKAYTAEKYGTMTILFMIPGEDKTKVNTSSIKVKDTDYDEDDDELDIDFSTKVSIQKTASVTVKDKNNTSYEAEITDYDNDDCTISFYDSLTYGESYTLTIKGIKASKASDYGSFTVKFVAKDQY